MELTPVDRHNPHSADCTAKPTAYNGSTHREPGCIPVIASRRKLQRTRKEMNIDSPRTEPAMKDRRAPLFIGFRRLFASWQSPTGKIFGGEANASTVVVPSLRSGTGSVSLGRRPIGNQIFLHCLVCPSAENPSDRINRDTQKKRRKNVC